MFKVTYTKKMKRNLYRIWMLLLLLTFTTLRAQAVDSLFVQANKLYQSEKYAEALQVYSDIEKKGIVSYELYYNIANTYYKTNEVAQSVYYYEKALQIKPNDEDVLFNLDFANRMTIDNIEPLPKSIGDNYRENVVLRYSYNTWATIAVVFAVLFAVLFLLYHFSDFTSRKQLFFISSLVCAVLVFIAVTFAYQNKTLVEKANFAIVFAPQVNVKNAPTMNSELNFTLHEGTKVQILETLDNWRKIKIADGKIGWMDVRDLKEL